MDPGCALDCSVVPSSRDAQAESNNAIAERKAAKIARRFITMAKLTMIPLSLKSLRLSVVGIDETKVSSFAVAPVGW